MPRHDYYLPERKLVSQGEAAIIQRPDVPRSKFLNTWTRKTAFDAGILVPFLVDEVLPGDHLQYNVTAYVRMATPLFPIFDNQRIDTFFFFIPNRLVWGAWKYFMGEELNAGDGIGIHTHPFAVCPADGYDVGSIFDHMGLPCKGQITVGQGYRHSTLPLRAYNLVCFNWFYAQYLSAAPYLGVADGQDTSPQTKFGLIRRTKPHDYFTSALPWPQKFTSPTVSLGGQAPVLGIGWSTNVFDTNGGAGVDVYDSTHPTTTVHYDSVKSLYSDLENNIAYIRGDEQPNIYADLSAATGVAINTFRQAFLVQQLQERDARGGTRYTELIRTHFGVRSPDARLQRPEYIGGGQTPLNITPIAQTAPTAGVPLGALGATGTGAGSHRASYAATEHGIILGLINIRTELSYQQGLPRMWSRETRYDYYWPSLAHLGEQAILMQELYCTGEDLNDAQVWGYQERWHEYRTRTSEVTGLMRSTAVGTLDAWHLAQKFLAYPTLTDTFLSDDPPMFRILAAGEEAENQQYLADILINRTAVRPLPAFGTPATLGRF